MSKTGKLSINSENMLPIIKKWLYSDHDIFVREQVANACDAITKLKKLEGVGEFRPVTPVNYEVHVEVDPDEKTLKFIDNGIGMTEEEVEKYITQIAFSGANEFLKKYEGKTDKDQIIGHFGLGCTLPDQRRGNRRVPLPDGTERRRAGSLGERRSFRIPHRQGHARDVRHDHHPVPQR